MKKIISIILCFVMLNVFITSFKASAAEYNSVAGIVATESTSLNVRSSPSASAAVLTTLKKGSYVTLISKSGAWWKVEYGKNAYGYCSSSYINTLSSYAADVNITSGVLNVRSGAGTAYSVKTTLSKGTTVVVLLQIKYNEVVGKKQSSIYQHLLE